jgi:hypothetical protein
MPSPITATTRYIHPETAVVYWVPTVADVNAPTRAELEVTGVGALGAWDLTAEIADAAGWEISATRVPVPDLGNRYTSKIAGRIETGDAQLMFYASNDTQDIRTVLQRGDRGVIVIMHGGDVPTQLCDVYPVDIVSVSAPLNVAGDPAQITIDFAVNALPGEQAPIPAAGP